MSSQGQDNYQRLHSVFLCVGASLAQLHPPGGILGPDLQCKLLERPTTTSPYFHYTREKPSTNDIQYSVCSISAVDALDSFTLRYRGELTVA